MPYRSPLQELPANLWRTIVGTFDFRGRSTRTEVWTYYIVGNVVANLVEFGLVRLIGEAGAFRPTLASSMANVLFLAPLPALVARRLHDIGWSGWWSALLPPLLVLATLSENPTPAIAGIAKHDFGWPGPLLVLGGILFLFAVSLAPPDERGHRYGMNPRLDDAV